MSTVLGLDLSLRRTGLALWRDGDMSTDHVLGAGIDAKDRGQRILRVSKQAEVIRREIGRVEFDAGLDLIVIEDYLIHGVHGYGSVADLIQLHGFVLNAVAAWRIPFAYVNVGTLKAFATGKGRADKAAMLDFAKGCGWTPANHDEADACWLAAMGASALGDEVPFGLTEWRASGLEKVAWPDSAITAANHRRDCDHLASTLSDQRADHDHSDTPDKREAP